MIQPLEQPLHSKIGKFKVGSFLTDGEAMLEVYDIQPHTYTYNHLEGGKWSVTYKFKVWGKKPFSKPKKSKKQHFRADMNAKRFGYTILVKLKHIKPPVQPAPKMYFVESINYNQVSKELFTITYYLSHPSPLNQVLKNVPFNFSNG